MAKATGALWNYFQNGEEVYRQNEYCFTIINKENCSLPITVVHSVNRFSNF